MINFLLGTLFIICIILIIAVIYLVKYHVKGNSIIRTKEDIEKEKEEHKHYGNMMNYSADKAYGGPND